MLRFVVCALTALVSAGSVAVAASPTPVPGGANAVSAVSGSIGQTLFNGVLRLQVVELRDATTDEIASLGGVSEGKKALAMTVLLRNGTAHDFIDLVRYSLADKDDVAFDISDRYVTPNPPHILQAAAFRQKAIFAVDKDFVPAKLVVQCATCGASTKFKAFRVTL